jgi:DNA-binding NarL/FixJ family response regulator
MIRLLIADDHDAIRFSMICAFEESEDITVVGEANNGKEALDQCQALQPDVVLMDIYMPDMDGITATQRIRELFPRIRIIGLTNAASNKPLVSQMISAGAVQCLGKNVTLDTLYQAVRLAANLEDP